MDGMVWLRPTCPVSFLHVTDLHVQIGVQEVEKDKVCASALRHVCCISSYATIF